MTYTVSSGTLNSSIPYHTIPISKLFHPLIPANIPDSKGKPSASARWRGYHIRRPWVKYTWCEKCQIFDGIRRLSRKGCEIGRWLLWNVNTNSCVPDQTLSYSMTLSDRRPGFQGHHILPSRIPQNWISGFQGHSIFRCQIAHKRHEIEP